ncbi:MAG TPA: serine/threonine-protein kinase [Kribbella sp.]|nr:serine/threonine-protein kinase [Kribbella sp.]
MEDIAGTRTADGQSRPPSAVGATLTAVAASLLERPPVEPAAALVAGRYRLRSRLGRGSMGVVWLAQDEVLHRSVALKQITRPSSAEAATRTTLRAQALGEARAAAGIDNPGVVRIHDVVESDGFAWVVMELLSGRTLREVLDADGPLPVSEVTRIARCLLDALRATHRAGIVHRDVKPANVQLCDDGRVVLTDFGIARTEDDDSSVSTAEFAGSPAYVAPEQAKGGAGGPASDLFSLGATLFAAVEGWPPFGRESVFATLAAVLEEAPGPFLHAGPLRPLIEGLLAKTPERRLGVDAARAALEAVQTQAETRQRVLRNSGSPEGRRATGRSDVRSVRRQHEINSTRQSRRMRIARRRTWNGQTGWTVPSTRPRLDF